MCADVCHIPIHICPCLSDKNDISVNVLLSNWCVNKLTLQHLTMQMKIHYEWCCRFREKHFRNVDMRRWKNYMLYLAPFVTSAVRNESVFQSHIVLYASTRPHFQRYFQDLTNVFLSTWIDKNVCPWQNQGLSLTFAQTALFFLAVLVMARWAVAAAATLLDHP